MGRAVETRTVSLSASSDDSGIALDPVAVRDDLVRVTRELELQGAGLVVTLRISPTGDTPVAFRVTDPLASGLDIDDLGFHPAFEPADGRITAEETVIEGIAEPGYAREIVWGICPTRPKPPADVRRLHESVPPTIAKAERWNGETGVNHRHEDTARNEVERTSERGAATSLFAKLKRRLWGEPTAPQPDSAAAEPPAPSERVESDRRREAALEHLDGVFTNLEAADAEPPRSEREPAAESAVDWADFWGVSTAQSTRTGRSVQPDDLGDWTEGPLDLPAPDEVEDWSTLEFDSKTVTEADEEYRTFAQLFEGIEAGATDRDSDGTDGAELDIATRLIEQLDDGWPVEKRQQLAEELLDETARTRLSAAGLDDRLNALEAQADRVSDFNEALAAMIDTHGSADEYLSMITDELENLESARRSVQRQIDQATSERESHRDQIEAVAERTKRIESKLDRLENQETALRSRCERTFSSYETELSDLESVAEVVEAMESAVRPLR